MLLPSFSLLVPIITRRVKSPHLDLPERSGRFGKKTDKLSERSEFLPVPETSALRRDPPEAGKDSWAPFFWLLFLGVQKE